MTPTDTGGNEARFWALAEPLLARPDVTRSTMMGLPCLRRAGAFFACYDRRTGHLVVKLSETRVTELIDAGRALPFAPAGRGFRRWAAVPPADSDTEADTDADADAWAALLGEACSVS
jgi:hypothetical protein